MGGPQQTIQYDAPAAPPQTLQYDAAEKKDEPGFLDRFLDSDIKPDPNEHFGILGYPSATKSGAQSIGRGVRSAVEGIGRFVAHPIDTAKDTASAIADIPSQVKQVPAAIHDINESPDPTGTYLKVGQETAGEGAGQALTAIATEGLGKGVAKVGPRVIRGAARGANAVLDKAPGTIGAGAGAAIGHATGIPGASEIGAGVGYGIGREVLPKIKIPGEHFGFPDRVAGGPKLAPPYRESIPLQLRGAEEPRYVGTPEAPAARDIPFANASVVEPKQLPESASVARDLPYRKVGGFEPEHVGPPDSTVLAGRRGVRVAKPRGLALPPAPEPETAIPPISATKPSAVNPAADLDRQLNEALGGKPLERNIPIGKQRPLGNVSEQIKEAVGPSQQPPRAPLGNLPKQISDSMNPLPEGFTAADSSAIRGYKYNPAERELEAITNTGQHYVHGDVSPEEFSKFEAADSKGKAWNDLRKAPGVTQVATVQNGSRLPTKPGVLKTAKGVIAKSKAGMDPNADLTSPLEESVKQALARKSRVARPK